MRKNITKTASFSDRRVVLLDDAKRHCDVTHDDDDIKIKGLIDSATDYIESVTEIAATEANYIARFAGWPCPFELTPWPLISVQSVEYYDGNVTWPEFTDFEAIIKDRLPGELELLPDASFPTIKKRGYPVVVDFTAGFTAANTPPALIHAVKLLVRHWYDNPNPVVVGTITSEVGRSLQSLLRTLKPGSVAGSMGAA